MKLVYTDLKLTSITPFCLVGVAKKVFLNEIEIKVGTECFNYSDCGDNV